IFAFLLVLAVFLLLNYGSNARSGYMAQAMFKPLRRALFAIHEIRRPVLHWAFSSSSLRLSLALLNFKRATASLALTAASWLALKRCIRSEEHTSELQSL